MSIFELKNISKNFDGHVVLSDISLSVDEGEVVALIGPSGSGKSTLLRCATLLETMDTGSLAYENEYACKDTPDGSVYADAKKLRSISKKFGLVFQDFNLFPHWNSLRNVGDALVTVQGVSKDEAKEKAHALLVKMGLEQCVEKYPYQLSGGQKQRVAIARALATEPTILFFDEPTSALDPELTQEILRVIRKLASENMTMVIVTHEINFAKSVADRVIFMADGFVVEEGLPSQVIDNPTEERTRAFLKKLEQ